MDKLDLIAHIRSKDNDEEHIVKMYGFRYMVSGFFAIFAVVLDSNSFPIGCKEELVGSIIERDGIIETQGELLLVGYEIIEIS